MNKINKPNETYIYIFSSNNEGLGFAYQILSDFKLALEQFFLDSFSGGRNIREIKKCIFFPKPFFENKKREGVRF